MKPIPSEFLIEETQHPLPVAVQLDSLPEKVASLIRQRAELANNLKKKEQQTNRQKSQFLLHLLDVTDAFDRIFRNVDLTELNEIGRNLVGSFRVTNTLLENVLSQDEVFVMDELEGKPFDPQTQEVVGVDTHTPHPEGTVLSVVEKGYYWHEKVLRRARVIVSKK